MKFEGAVLLRQPLLLCARSIDCDVLGRAPTRLAGAADVIPFHAALIGGYLAQILHACARRDHADAVIAQTGAATQVHIARGVSVCRCRGITSVPPPLFIETIYLLPPTMAETAFTSSAVSTAHSSSGIGKPGTTRALR